MSHSAIIGPASAIAEYLDDPYVRTRIAEYCGATGDHGPTCAFVTGLDPDIPPFWTWDQAPHYPPDHLDALRRRGADISRALWDASHLVLLFEIDYQNSDRPQEPFEHPARVFRLLEPVYQATVRALRQWGLPADALVTGRGYQFTSQVSLDERVVDRLSTIAPGVPH